MLKRCVNKKIFSLISLIFVVLTSVSAYAKNTIPEEIKSLASIYNVPLDNLSIIVQPIGSEIRLINLNSNVYRNPASVTKLFTAYVGIDYLGPDFTWTTKVFSSDAINDGVIDSLIFQGGGDPYITIEHLRQMVTELRSLGIHTINNGLIVEQEFFQQPRMSTSVFDDDPLRPYNVMHTSFLVNSNKIDFTVTKKSTNTVQIEPVFLPAGVSFLNQLEMVTGSCGNFRDDVNFTEIIQEKYPPHTVIVLTGMYPENCDSFIHDISLTDPNHYFFGAFKRLWLESGGSFKGYIRGGKTRLFDKPLVSFDSATLAEIATESVKESDNLISRHIFLSLNQSLLGKKNYKASRKIMKEVLSKNGINITDSAFIENGSGLSRNTKIRPETILDLLQAMEQHPSSDILLNALPVSGIDGTLEDKYQSDLLKKRLKLKTGTLDGVTGLAGFITGLSGKEYRFVFIHNDIPDYSYRVSPFREALLNWVVDDIN